MPARHVSRVPEAKHGTSSHRAHPWQVEIEAVASLFTAYSETVPWMTVGRSATTAFSPDGPLQSRASSVLPKEGKTTAQSQPIIQGECIRVRGVKIKAVSWYGPSNPPPNMSDSFLCMKLELLNWLMEQVQEENKRRKGWENVFKSFAFSVFQSSPPLAGINQASRLGGPVHFLLLVVLRGEKNKTRARGCCLFLWGNFWLCFLFRRVPLSVCHFAEELCSKCVEID